MAVARLGPNGEVEVLAPPTAEEIAAAEEGLLRVARALGALMAERDWAAAQQRLSHGEQDRGGQADDYHGDVEDRRGL